MLKERLAQFPPSGPGPDASRQAVDDFVHLTLFDLVVRANTIIEYVCKGDWRKAVDEGGELHGWNKVARSGRDKLKARYDSIGNDFKILQKWVRVAPDADSRSATAAGEFNLDDVAEELCKAHNLGDWRRDGDRRTAAATIPPEGPIPQTPMALTIGYFQGAYGNTRAQNKCLINMEKKGVSRGARSLIKIAQQTVGAKVAILNYRAELLGAATGKNDPKRRRAIDLLLNEIRWRQQINGVTEPDRPRLLTLRRYAAAIRRARLGDYWPYRWMNGVTRSSGADTGKSRSKRFPLQLAPCHFEIAQSRMAELICKNCGCFHLQDVTPQFVAAMDDQFVFPVTCPHCGQTDCAGPRNHRIAGCREVGKTQEMEVSLPYAESLCIHRGYNPSALLIGSNKEQTNARKGRLATTMARGAHWLVFPEAVPCVKQPTETLVLESGATILTAFGIESLPPGLHCDYIECDDVVNARVCFQVPALMIVVQQKLDDVIDYSGVPWTVLNWNTTTWRIDDPDHQLEKYAEAHSEDWVNCVIAAGGPEPQYDESGNIVKEPFWSPWPSRWPSAILEARYNKNHFSYERNMMMIRVSEEDVVFKRVDLYLRDDDPLFSKCPQVILEGCHVVKAADLKAMPRLVGYDLAFTGEQVRRSDPRKYRRRSQTSSQSARINPQTKNLYLDVKYSEFLAPNEHEETIARRAMEGNYEAVGIETDKTVSELLLTLADRGVYVEQYTPSGMGSKSFRKWGPAAAFNSGRAMLPGRLHFAAVKGASYEDPQYWEVVSQTGWGQQRSDMLVFPLRETDEIDALEVLIRTANKLYGAEADADPQSAVPEQNLDRVSSWRREAMQPAKEPGDPLIDELEGLFEEPVMPDLPVGAMSQEGETWVMLQ